MNTTDRITLELATGLGLGDARKAPGTIGALLGFPIVWFSSALPFSGQLAIVVVLCLIGIPLCGRAAQLLGKKDPCSVVWDEFTTVPIVFLGIPQADLTSFALIAGFVIHRFFDILKFWPCNTIERFQGGLGIMGDDIVAGIYGWMLLRLVIQFVSITP